MSNDIKIQVFGSNCSSCKKLHELVKEAVLEMNLTADIEYITDIQRIIDMGIMTSPVLAVNSKPILAGSVPNKEKIMKLLKENIV